MNKVNKNIDDKDVKAFFRRADKDSDNRISYSEFLEAFCVLDAAKLNKNKNINYTSNFGRNLLINSNFSKDRIKEQYEKKTNTTPHRKSIEDNDLLSNYVKRSYTSPIKKNSISPGLEIKNISPINYRQKVQSQQQSSQKLPENQTIKEVRLPSSSSLLDSFNIFKTPGKLTKNLIKLDQYTLKKHPQYQPHHSLIKKKLYNDLTHQDISKNKLSIENINGMDDLRKHSNEKKISLMKPKEEDEFVKALKDQINNNRELESLKNVLALRKDFNIHDIFHIFDKNNNGYITEKEFLAGLNKFNIKPNKVESFLIMKRLDRNFDGTIKYVILLV